MADPKPERQKALADQLFADRKTSDGLWEEIATYMRPQRLGIQSRYSPGTDLTTRVFDSTSIVAARKWTDAVHFALCNPFTRWFEMAVAVNDEDLISPAITDWLQDTSTAMHKAINDSNFTSSVNETFLDLGLFGNCSLQCEQSKVEPRFRLEFQGLHLRDSVPLIGGYDRIRATYYRPELYAIQIAEQFAAEEWNAQDYQALAAKVGDKVAMLLKEGKYADKVACLHSVYPRPQADVKLGADGLTKDLSARPFASNWMIWDDAHNLKTGGYYEQSRIWARLRRRTDDPMGAGIGEEALPDTYSCNEWRRQILKASEKEIDPGWIQEVDQFQGTVNMGPRGIITVADIDKVKQQQISPTVTVQMVGADLRQSILDIWMADELTLPPREKIGQMTAYETAKRVERIYQIMGPMIDRISREKMTPMLERVFGIMRRNGKIPEMPEELLELGEQGKATLEFRFQGAVARAQYGEAIAAMDDTWAWVKDAAQVKPDILDKFDMDKHAEKRAQLSGYPADLLVADKVVKRVRDEREKQAAAMNAAAAGRDAAASMRDLSAAGVEPERAALQLAGGTDMQAAA